MRDDKMDFLIIVYVVCSLAAVDAFNVSLHVVSTLQYDINAFAAEQMTYDHRSKLLYSVGSTNIRVIDISDVSTPTVIYHTSVANGDVTDVEHCGDHVFVLMNNLTHRDGGSVNVYRAYDNETNTMDLVQSITVGAIPDMLKVAKDCMKLVVAVEAEPYDDVTTQTLVDPPGTVAIVTFHEWPAGEYSLNSLNFTKFDNSVSELEKEGVRFIYKGNNNTFSNDVEPEYIAFNEDETKAYICLQENNAIAVVDLVTEEITGIHGLGYKDWASTRAGLDVSDRDNGIHMRPWPVFGMYQPDTIYHVTIGGVAYLLTANEGGAKDYRYFSEETRVKDVTLSDIFEPNATLRHQLQEDANLGRLKITTENGKNETTDQFDKLYTFGGRSFSIFRADTMEMVYDSGSDIGERIAAERPALFNSNVKVGEVASSSMDTRSDDKGCETETIAVGHIGETMLIFVGNERPGTIFVYSVDDQQSPIQPKFETMIDGIKRTNDTWDNLVAAGDASMLDPEDMKFLAAEESPTGEPLLLVSGSASGTVTILKVKVNDDTNTGSRGILNTGMAVALLLLFVAVV